MGFVKLQSVANYEKKIEAGPLGDLEKFPKKNFQNEIFEQCHSAEKCKRGEFLKSIVLQNIERNEGGPFNAIQKNSKKSHNAEKWKIPR